MIPRASRIGIVGAGASGLAAAHALARAGYRQVTVLERNDRVGGKCSTFTFEGRSYELGAGALTTAYTNVRSLMDEVGVRGVPSLSGLFIDLDSGRSSFLPDALRTRSLFRLGLEGVGFARTLRRARRFLRPGFGALDDDLCAPFSEWAKRHRLDGMTELIAPWFTGFGYGYLDEIPAAYVLKYAALFRFPIFEILDGGYQGLWERVARPLDVRCNVAIRRITRDDQHVTVESDGERFEFDALILACPLDDALSAIDAGDEERALWSRIRYNDYHVVAAEMERAPDARYGFFAKHLTRAHAGEVIFWYRRWKERDLVLFYTLPPPGGTLDATEATVRATIARMGGRTRAIHTRHAWRYFPHVSSADLREGFYPRLERLQGARRTWFVGELMNFSTVETVVAYARDLVARHFAGSILPSVSA